MERVAVVGIGRLGLCFALALERAGMRVLGIDKNRELVEEVRARTFRTVEPGVEEALGAARNLVVDTNLAALRTFEPTMVFITVDTPSLDGGGYDTANVDRVIFDLGAAAERVELIDLVLVSTTLPGYGDARAEQAATRGYALSYAPTFIAQGTIVRDLTAPNQLLIGEATPAAGDRIERVLRRACTNEPSVHRMSRLAAEITKLATNSFLTTKIAFANALGDLAVRAGADPEAILRAIGADPRIGGAYLRYGFGYGGPCLPRDNGALNLFAERVGAPLLIGLATDEMNRRHLAFQVEQALAAHPAGDAIVMDGVTYKSGTDILEASQPLALAIELARAGRRVIIRESTHVIAKIRAEHGDLFEYRARDELDHGD